MSSNDDDDENSNDDKFVKSTLQQNGILIRKTEKFFVR